MNKSLFKYISLFLLSLSFYQSYALDTQIERFLEQVEQKIANIILPILEIIIPRAAGTQENNRLIAQLERLEIQQQQAPLARASASSSLTTRK